ncbi:MAG: dimethylglycine dehydrogenase, partial [Paracoccaceae bacterium]
GDTVEVYVLGQPHKARILHAPPFDPAGARLRA